MFGACDRSPAPPRPVQWAAMPHDRSTPPPARSWRGQLSQGALLSWAAGFVDAFGYLYLARVFTAHMSGNTSSFGLFLSLHEWKQVAWHAWPVAMFAAGLLAGAAIMEGGRRLGRNGMAVVLILEIALIAGLLAAAADTASGPLMGARGALRWGIVALPALAMGLQTVTITRIGDLPISTTFITGSLAMFGENAVQFLFSLWARQPEERGAGRERLRHSAAALTLWAAFFVGAIAGAAGKLGWGAAALGAPLVALAVVLWRCLHLAGTQARASGRLLPGTPVRP